VVGVATTIPADVAILSHPDFVAAKHSTTWVEGSLDLSGLTAGPDAAPPAEADGAPELRQRDVTAEVDGRRYKVSLWLPDTGGDGAAPAAPRGGGGGRRRGAQAMSAAGGSGTVTVPMQGTIVKVLVSVGDEVEAGQTICVLEAMKMENAVNAETAGTVKEVRVAAGDPVGSGDVVAVIE
jgi:acetyl-CoA/propionyl-CoA carboxylase biotin carboxyl carrier protein